MSTKKRAPKLTEEHLAKIIRRYDHDELVISKAYADGGTDPLWPRFERSAMAQNDNGSATVSRYAIWANTVRDNIIQGMADMEQGDVGGARQYLVRAANSLSAFADVQTHFDNALKS